MRPIVFHRRAARYLIRMPRDRAIQVRDALREVAALANIADHPGIRLMSGEMAGWSRLRVGSYRPDGAIPPRCERPDPRAAQGLRGTCAMPPLADDRRRVGRRHRAVRVG